jgi:hypothetical protein
MRGELLAQQLDRHANFVDGLDYSGRVGRPAGFPITDYRLHARSELFSIGEPIDPDCGVQPFPNKLNVLLYSLAVFCHRE